MTVAFDFGSHYLRSLAQTRKSLVGKQLRCGYQVLPDTDAWRNVLGQLSVPFATGPQSLVVVGNDAERVEGLTPLPFSSLFPDGRLDEADPAARQILAQLVELAIKPANRENELCCITLPAEAYDNRKASNAEMNLCSQLIELRGYEVRILSSSMALILAAAEPTAFTGIGINFGANSCCVSLARKGIEVAYLNVPTGGDWIDSSLARDESRFVYDVDGSCYLDGEAVRNWRESLTSSIAEPTSERERTLREYYDQMITQTIHRIAQPLESAYRGAGLTESLHIYIGGGASQANGFNRVASRLIQTDHNFRIPVASVRVLQDNGFLTARGCLINAEIESAVLQRKSAA